MVLDRNGKNNPNSSFDWRNAVMDAGIMAGLTFFTSLGGAAVARVPTTSGLIIAGIAAGAEFFLVLAIKRGLREKE